jgi:hypothetical protein
MSTKMSKTRIDELVRLNLAQDQELTRAWRKAKPFLKTLKKVLEKNKKELTPLWDAIDFSQVDPSCFQDEIFEVIMEVWKNS